MGFGAIYTSRACNCQNKDKNNWSVVGKCKGVKPAYIIYCHSCHNQWRTKAKYVEELKSK